MLQINVLCETKQAPLKNIIEFKIILHCYKNVFTQRYNSSFNSLYFRLLSACTHIRFKVNYLYTKLYSNYIILNSYILSKYSENCLINTHFFQIANTRRFNVNFILESLKFVYTSLKENSPKSRYVYVMTQ